MAPPLLTARKAAWLVLNQCDIMRHDAGERLHEILPGADRPGQATDIVFGVLRNRSAIDHVIKISGRVEPARVKPGLWNLLRIGTYELVYAPKTAEYGILNELGNLARQKGSARTVGFINAVLRSVQKNIADRQAAITDSPVRQILPQDAQTGCRFRVALLPDPARDPVNYYSLAFSLPPWLAAQWLKTYGPEQTRGICLASNRSPSLIAQPNTLCTTAENLARQLTAQGIDCELDAPKKMLSIKQAGQITKIQAFLDGLFTIQDPTAADSMSLLNPEPGWTVADLCAAPGGKSIALAMLMGDRGRILASDSSLERLQKVRQNIERMRLSAVETISPARIEQTMQKLKTLNAVVLDVPCSNTGVLARRVEARWRLRPDGIRPLLETQRRLLNDAAAYCQQNTHIVYSTCSIQPEENQQQIQQFLNQHSAFQLINEKLTLPALKTAELFDHDGGYVAILARK